MGSGYGACEDRGCGNVGSVQEVSTHTLICYIDHPSTVHSIDLIAATKWHGPTCMSPSMSFARLVHRK